jgi:hypothetical protein
MAILIEVSDLDSNYHSAAGNGQRFTVVNNNYIIKKQNAKLLSVFLRAKDEEIDRIDRIVQVVSILVYIMLMLLTII